MNKIKILHLLTGLSVGGGEKAALELAKYTDKKHFDIQVISVGKHKDMLNDFQENNIPIKIIDPKHNYFRLWRIINLTWVGYKRLAQEIKAYQPDILHAHMGHAIILATLLKLRFPQIKLVFNSQNYIMDSTIGSVITYLFKWLRSADIVFAKDMANGIYRKDATVIPNGIDTQMYGLHQPKFDQFTFICVGRLTKQKNQLALIKPVSGLKKAGFFFQLLIVGEGEDRLKIEAAIAKYDIQDCIKLLGLRRDIPKLYNKAHCFIMPSLWEGLPLAMLEAASSQLPVIITDVGSVSTLVEAENGYMVKDLEDLFETMKTVINNYEIALQKASRLKNKVRNEYDVAIIARKHEALYTSLISKEQISIPQF